MLPKIDKRSSQREYTVNHVVVVHDGLVTLASHTLCRVLFVEFLLVNPKHPCRRFVAINAARELADLGGKIKAFETWNVSAAAHFDVFFA